MSQLRQQFISFLKFRNLSERTQESYTTAIIKLSQFYNQPPHEITSDQIINYINHLSLVKKRTFSTCNVNLSAIKLFYNQFLGDHSLAIELPPRKGPKKLPVFLNVEEIEALLLATSNPKMRTFFMTAYGTGMRLGELINLKVSDIDSSLKNNSGSKRKRRQRSVHRFTG